MFEWFLKSLLNMFLNIGGLNFLSDFYDLHYLLFGHFFGLSRTDLLYLTLRVWYLTGPGEPDKLLDLIYFFIYLKEPSAKQLWIFALTLDRIPEYSQDPRLPQITEFIFTFV